MGTVFMSVVSMSTVLMTAVFMSARCCRSPSRHFAGFDERLPGPGRCDSVAPRLSQRADRVHKGLGLCECLPGGG